VHHSSFHRAGLLVPALLLVATSCRKSTPSASPQPVQSPQPQLVQTAQPLPAVVTQPTQQQSCRQFVQDFYDWYSDQLKRDSNRDWDSPGANLYTDDVRRFKPEVLSPKLRRMLKEDEEASAKNPNEIVGLDADPFTAAQEWQGKYQAGNATWKDGHCRVAVWHHKVGEGIEAFEPELIPANGSWIFVNIRYIDDNGASSDDLIQTLATLKQEREHPTPDPAPKK
jgi:hypothetical protein